MTENVFTPTHLGLKVLRKKMYFKEKYNNSLLLKVNSHFIVCLEILDRSIITNSNMYFLLEVFLDTSHFHNDNLKLINSLKKTSFYMYLLNLDTNDKLNLKFNLYSLLKEFFPKLLKLEKIPYNYFIIVAKYLSSRIKSKTKILFKSVSETSTNFKKLLSTNHLLRFLATSNTKSLFDSPLMEFPLFVSRKILCSRKRLMLEIYFEEKTVLKVLIRNLKEKKIKTIYLGLTKFCLLSEVPHFTKKENFKSLSNRVHNVIMSNLFLYNL